MGFPELLHGFLLRTAQGLHVLTVGLPYGRVLFPQGSHFLQKGAHLCRLGGTLTMEVLPHLTVEFFVGMVGLHDANLQKIIGICKYFSNLI